PRGRRSTRWWARRGRAWRRRTTWRRWRSRRRIRRRWWRPRRRRPWRGILMRQKANKSNRPTRRPAMVLFVVLVVVVMLTLAAYTYVSLMRSHRESSVQTNRQLQAKLMVDSGTDYVRTFLLQSLDAQL